MEIGVIKWNKKEQAEKEKEGEKENQSIYFGNKEKKGKIQPIHILNVEEREEGIITQDLGMKHFLFLDMEGKIPFKKKKKK